MLPVCSPSDANGDSIVFSLASVDGLTEWVDYIPVQIVALDATLINKTDPGGFRQVNALASDSGLLSFKDFIPVFVVTGRSTPWNTGADGYIPMYAATGDLGGAGAAPDPTFSNVVMLAENFDGVNGNQIAQASPAHVNDWVASTGVADYDNGGVETPLFGATTRAKIVGVSQFAGIVQTGSLEFDINTQDFCIEAIVEFIAVSGPLCIAACSQSTNSREWELTFDHTGPSLLLRLWELGTGDTPDATITFPFDPAVDTRYEIAVGRDVNGVRCYINGTQVGSETANSTDVYNSAGVNTFIAYTNNSQFMRTGNQYYDCFRFTIGEMHITENYTARTAQYPTS